MEEDRRVLDIAPGDAVHGMVGLLICRDGTSQDTVRRTR